MGPATRLKVVLVATLMMAGAFAIAPLEANAGTLRTQVFDFNACDQYLVPGHSCRGISPNARADAIAHSILSGGSNVVTLQEICLTSLNRIVNALDSGWRGRHLGTAFLDADDNRCAFPGQAGGKEHWGLGIIARTSVEPSQVSWALLPNSTAPGTENRYLFCGNFPIAASFRVCSSHFSTSAQWSVSQAANVGSQLSSYAANGGAILLGVDANINARDCGAALYMRPIYIANFGGPYDASTCQAGYGAMYEADQQHIGGDGDYTDVTYPPEGWKIDYVFFNHQKWYATYDAHVSNSTVSDHRILRGAGTLFW
jgi:endonuclease/exonuclease/phosphatase family metal-dependent hydrolase